MVDIIVLVFMRIALSETSKSQLFYGSLTYASAPP